MSQLTRKEAQALLTELEHLTLGQVLPNTDLINAVICLKQIATPIAIVPVDDQVTVMLEVGLDEKITAIKAYRTLTDTGLKVAKETVDSHWVVRSWNNPRSVQTIPVGPMARSEFERRASDIEKDTYLRGRVRLHAVPA